MKKTSYIFGDKGAQQCDSRPEEDAAAQNDLPVKSVAKVTEDGCRHHETADENCERENEKFHISYNTFFGFNTNHQNRNDDR